MSDPSRANQPENRARERPHKTNPGRFTIAVGWVALARWLSGQEHAVSENGEPPGDALDLGTVTRRAPEGAMTEVPGAVGQRSCRRRG